MHNDRFEMISGKHSRWPDLSEGISIIARKFVILLIYTLLLYLLAFMFGDATCLEIINLAFKL